MLSLLNNKLLQEVHILTENFVIIQQVKLPDKYEIFGKFPMKLYEIVENFILKYNISCRNMCIPTEM